MKKRIVSLVLLVAFLGVLSQGSVFGMNARAESLKLSSYNGWYSTAKAANLTQIRKVSNLSASQTSSEFSGKVEDLLFTATYRPTDIGGKDWVKGNHGYGIVSVYDAGLGTTVSWGTLAWGCFSYAVYFSQYVRGCKGTPVSVGDGYIPSVSEIKNLIESRADPGEHIRYYYKSPYGYESVHSVAYLASDSDGFYYASESGDELKIGVYYCTYSHFRTALRVCSGDSTLKVYDTNGGKDGKTGSKVVKSSNSSGDKVVVTSAKPAPRKKPDTSEYKVPYSRVLMWRRYSGIMSGNDVKYMQACLYYLGYDVDIDGFYGSGTTAVVKLFQSHYKLDADGAVGYATWSAIENAVLSYRPAASLKIKTNPKNSSVAVGGKVKLSVSATGSKLKYQWYYKKPGQKSWTLWGGHNASYTYVNGSSEWNGAQFCCKVTDGSGKSVKSNAAVVTVVSGLKITSQPKSATVAAGGKITLSVKAQGKGLSYQWYYKLADKSEWSVLTGKTRASETVNADNVWDGAGFRCKVTDSSGKSLMSDTAVITLMKPLKITSHPSSATVTFGDKFFLSVKAQGTGLSYQWYYKLKDKTEWHVLTSKNHASETINADYVWSGAQFYCKVTDSSGKSVKSKAAVITMVKAFKITGQPESRTVASGDSMTLSVKAEGTGLSYQWYYKKKNETSWSKWKGRTNAAESVAPNESWNGIKLYCQVKDASGRTLNSNTATITVKESALKILVQPKSAAISLGNSFTVSVKAKGTGLSYQWFYKKRKDASWTLWNGRTKAAETVAPNEIWDGIQLYCMVKDSSGRTVQSDVAIVVVN